MKNKPKQPKTTFIQSLKKLFKYVSNQDKRIIISFITGCLFSLLGIIQVLFVMFSTMARTFDRFSLIIVDFIIAAICFVFVFYRQGKLKSFPILDEITHSIDKADSEMSDAASRICIPGNKTTGKPERVRSSSGSAATRRSSVGVVENENLFSPRHRYSERTVQPRHSTGSAHANQYRSSKFNSRHTGR